MSKYDTDHFWKPPSKAGIHRPDVAMNDDRKLLSVMW
jgi:hypothetical protein|uniref:Uncharacterized protein n=1 Tax=Enterobacter cloacae TaxID=550 RepID=A0A6C0NEK3_ENTCL|nr:Hypothetical protein [Enterobacter cloacae]UFD96620.1 hypothetical protein [Klebsiella oxytoca]